MTEQPAALSAGLHLTAQRTLRIELMAPDGSGPTQSRTVRFDGAPIEVCFDHGTGH